MSTEPGKGENTGSADRGSSSNGKPVVAAASEPARDEATVEIPPADDTKTDLPKIDPDKDPRGTASDSSSGGSSGAKETGAPQVGGASGPQVGGDAGSGVQIPPVSDAASGPQGSWTPPSQPAPSVSGDRVENRGFPSAPSGPVAPPSAPAVDGSNNAAPGIQPSMNPTPTGQGPAGHGPGNPASPAAGGPGPAAPPQAPPAGGQSRGPGGFSGTLLKNRAAKAAAGQGGNKPTGGKTARKAQLQLARLEPWSVMKFSFVMSLVCFVVLLVAVTVLYTILSWLGVFSAITDMVEEVTRSQDGATGGVEVGSWFSFARVFGYTVLVGALNVLLITALSTVGSVIYNLAADLVGGVEITLKEAE